MYSIAHILPCVEEQYLYERYNGFFISAVFVSSKYMENGSQDFKRLPIITLIKYDDIVYKLNKVQFFSVREHFSGGRQVFARSQHGFLRSEESLNLYKV